MDLTKAFEKIFAEDGLQNAKIIKTIHGYAAPALIAYILDKPFEIAVGKKQCRFDSKYDTHFFINQELCDGYAIDLNSYQFLHEGDMKVQYCVLENRSCVLENKVKNECVANEDQQNQEKMYDLDNAEAASENEEIEQTTITNLQKLIEILDEYEFICVEDIRLRDFIATVMNGTFIKESKFVETFEGALWNEIFQFQYPYESSMLDRLEFLKERKLNATNVFPYIQHSYLKDDENWRKIIDLLEQDKLKEMFELLFGFAPKWNPQSVKNEADRIFLQNAIVVEKIVQETSQKPRFFIDKTFIKFISEKVAFVSQVAISNVDININYAPKFEFYDAWSLVNFEEDIDLKSTYDEDLYYKGALAKLKAKQIGVRDFQKNLYSHIKKCVFDNIKKKVMNLRNPNVVANLDLRWQEYLQKSGIEYIAILNKALRLEENFFEAFERYSFSCVEFSVSFDDVSCDFYGSFSDVDGRECGCIILLSWSYFTYKNSRKIKKLVEMIKNANDEKNADKLTSVEKIIIVTCDCVTDVKFDTEFANEPEKKIPEMEDDLFYWNLF